jgi:hypothetical protein
LSSSSLSILFVHHHLPFQPCVISDISTDLSGFAGSLPAPLPDHGLPDKKDKKDKPLLPASWKAYLQRPLSNIITDAEDRYALCLVSRKGYEAPTPLASPGLIVGIVAGK